MVELKFQILNGALLRRQDTTTCHGFDSHARYLARISKEYEIGYNYNAGYAVVFFYGVPENISAPAEIAEPIGRYA